VKKIKKRNPFAIFVAIPKDKALFLEGQILIAKAFLRYYPAFNIPNFEIHRDNSNKTPAHCILITYKVKLILL